MSFLTQSVFNSFSSLLPHSPCAGIPSFFPSFSPRDIQPVSHFPFFVGGGGWQQQQLDPPGPKGQKEGGAELFGQDFGRQRRSKQDGHSSRPSRPTRRRGQKDLPGANSFYSLCLRPQCPFMTRLVSPIVPTPSPFVAFAELLLPFPRTNFLSTNMPAHCPSLFQFKFAPPLFPTFPQFILPICHFIPQTKFQPPFFGLDLAIKMLPPSLPFLPSALCPSPSSSANAKMMADPNSIPSPSSPPFWPIPQLPPKEKEILRVEIRCSCHIDLFDAQFSISHNEQTNDFFVELLQPAECRLSAPILCILFRFLPSQPEHLQIFPSTYGHWQPSGSVERYRPKPASDEPIRLHVHVHEAYYSVELNGKEVIRVEHKREFRRLPQMMDEDEEEQMAIERQKLVNAKICCACLHRQHIQQQQIGGTILAS